MKRISHQKWASSAPFHCFRPVSLALFAPSNGSCSQNHQNPWHGFGRFCCPTSREVGGLKYPRRPFAKARDCPTSREVGGLKSERLDRNRWNVSSHLPRGGWIEILRSFAKIIARRPTSREVGGLKSPSAVKFSPAGPVPPPARWVD